jgi:hypothetical protein
MPWQLTTALSKRQELCWSQHFQPMAAQSSAVQPQRPSGRQTPDGPLHWMQEPPTVPHQAG